MGRASAIQCQNCAVESTPPFMMGDNLPWRCQGCGARHLLSVLATGTVTSLKLIDGLTLPARLNCSGDVLDDLQEAFRAFNAGAPKAAVVMARRALETLCDEHGATGSNLVAKIKNMHANKIFDDATVDAASAVRQFGNYGAHPKDDELKGMSLKRAEHALRTAVNLLEDLPPQPQAAKK